VCGGTAVAPLAGAASLRGEVTKPAYQHGRSSMRKILLLAGLCLFASPERAEAKTADKAKLCEVTKKMFKGKKACEAEVSQMASLTCIEANYPKMVSLEKACLANLRAERKKAK
jgi:hypothetical protein